jgi:cold shock CspA family protein
MPEDIDGEDIQIPAKTIKRHGSEQVIRGNTVRVTWYDGDGGPQQVRSITIAEDDLRFFPLANGDTMKLRLFLLRSRQLKRAMIEGTVQ